MTKEEVLAMLADGRSHRKQFSTSNGIQKNKTKPTFSVPFDNGLLSRFKFATGKVLKWNPSHQQFYCFLTSQEEIEQAEAWANQQGTLVFIRNMLTTTTALDFNMVDNSSGQHTQIGVWESLAKHSQDLTAISSLVEASIAAISSVSYLSEADLICAIPAMSNKSFDLPRVLAQRVCGRQGIEDITSCFVLSNKELSVKACSMSEKWDVWANSKLDYNGVRLDGKRVILLDDKYQSGLTMHYFASILFQLGASEIHGLAMVKTLRDSDNTNVVE